MEIIDFDGLVTCINGKTAAVKKRLWIASPYVGDWCAVRSLLGRDWYENGAVDVRFLVSGINDGGYINRNTVEKFRTRGAVKQLRGLHAKIYIFDDEVLVTSANLTRAGFTANYEVGVFLTSAEAELVINIYEEWWRGLSEYLSSEDLTKLPLTPPRNVPNTNEGRHLPSHSNLPKDPGDPAGSIMPYFKNYETFLNTYKEFAAIYTSIQRLWKSQDPYYYFEIDAFLNYLYHEAEGTPSQEYKEKKVRRLSKASRLGEIKKYAKGFKKWLSNLNRSERQNQREWRVKASQRINKILSRGRMKSITRRDVMEVTNYLNCMNSYQIIKAKFLNPKNNELSSIRAAWNELLYGAGSLPQRMTYCKQTIKFFGHSSICELLGFFDPVNYPLRNTNVNAGLRFFGYSVEKY